jgi:hypothetical protein
MATNNSTKSLLKLFAQQSFVVVLILFPKLLFRTLILVQHCPSIERQCQQAQARKTTSFNMAPSMKSQIMRRQQQNQQHQKRLLRSNIMIKLSTVSSSTITTDDNQGNTRKPMVKMPEKDIALITNDGKVLLQQWMEHTHTDYHNFAPQEAVAIRSALLQWYTNHRRKLPWRGDPPPFDGSTSGRNNIKSENNNKKKADMIDEKFIQPPIQPIFPAKTQTSSTQTPVQNQKNDSLTLEDKEGMANNDNANLMFVEDALPVTGYGVWVSEIMLQQTRVEAVIPYWIRCEYSACM